MKELKVNWEEAPEGANIALFEDGIQRWWIEANFEANTYRFCLIGANNWVGGGVDELKLILTAPGRAYVEKHEPYVFNAKELKKTEAYKQLKRFIAVNNGTSADLGLLVKRVLQRTADFGGDIKAHPQTTIAGIFAWEETPEGWVFWQTVQHGLLVDNLHPGPIKPKKKVAAVRPPKPIEEKPKRVGWW